LGSRLRQCWPATGHTYYDRSPCFASIAKYASIAGMATLTIRQLDENTKARLRIRAAHHGRSMEEEAREILRSTLSAGEPATRNLAESIRRRFAPLGGVELKLPKRDSLRTPADLTP